MPRGWESIFLLMLNYLKFITCTEKVEVPLRWSIQEGQCYMMVRNFMCKNSTQDQILDSMITSSVSPGRHIRVYLRSLIGTQAF